MRMFFVAAAVSLAAPAWAQPVLDGKASVDEHVGSFVESYLENLKYPEGGASSFRSIISYVLTRPVTPEERDLFVEVASGKPVVVTAPGKTFNVPAATGQPLKTARLFAAPPNLNDLWQTKGEPILNLVEMARWGRFGKDRVVTFMTNKLFGAWVQSNRANAYLPWNGEFELVHQAMSAIEDTKVRDEAKLLLKAAMEQVFVRAKAVALAPPKDFQYAFAFRDVGQPAAPE